MAWTTEDWRSRYDRGRERSKDFVVGDSGEFYFNSSQSPQGYWIVRRRSSQLYSCNCPDYASERYQDLMKVTRPHEWQYRQWLGGDSEYQTYVPDCIHILAVRNFLHETDLNAPYPQLLTPRTGLTTPDCGCSSGKPCACSKRSLSNLLVVPPRKLLGNCPTNCYVPSLTPPQNSQPQYENPNWQELIRRSTIPQLVLEILDTACSGKTVDVRIVRLGNPDGYLDGFVTIYYNDLDAPVDGFEFTIKPDLFEYLYTWTIPEVGNAEFFFKLEAPVAEIVAPDTRSLIVEDCPPCEEALLNEDSDSIPCIGSYQALLYTTGKTLPDGSCETLSYYRYDAEVCPFPPLDPDPDFPFPDFPPFDPYPEDPDPDFPPIPGRLPFSPIPGGDCITTVYRDCTAFEPGGLPDCAAFSYRGQICGNDGESRIVNRGGICEEECNQYCVEIDIPQCDNPPCPEAVWTCSNKDRYIGWFSQDSTDGNYDLGKPPLLEFFPSGSVDTTVYDSFFCRTDNKVWVLVGYSIPPQPYLKDGGCIASPAPDCKFTENSFPRPVCSPPYWEVDAIYLNCSGCAPIPGGIIRVYAASFIFVSTNHWACPGCSGLTPVSDGVPWLDVNSPGGASVQTWHISTKILRYVSN